METEEHEENDWKATDRGESGGCPLCSYEWTQEETLLEREIHLNRCLDECDVDPMKRRVWCCPVCGHVSTHENITVRIRHLKTCCARAGESEWAGGKRVAGQGRRPDDEHPTESSSQDERFASVLSIFDEEDRMERALQMRTGIEAQNVNTMNDSEANKRPRLEHDAAESHFTTPPLRQTKITSFFSNHNHKTTTTTTIPPPPVPTTTTYPPPPPWSLIENTIIVDGFRFAHPRVSTYVLSHFHVDHYVGLDASFNRGVIYTSPPTARLVARVLRVPTSRIKVMRRGEWIALPGGLKVMTLDANHAPGSVMMLFRTAQARYILHTGDFRYCERITREITAHLQGSPLDELVLDTTYASYDFPSQNASVARAVELMRSYPHLVSPDTLIVFGSYLIGKERLALALLETLSLPPPASIRPGTTPQIHVSHERMNVIKLLAEDIPLRDQLKFTLDRKASRFWMVPMGDLRVDRLERLLRAPAKFKRVLAVRGTGWCRVASMRPCESNPAVTLLNVPYSEHSSRTELRRFLKELAPRRVTPSVGGETGEKAANILRGLK